MPTLLFAPMPLAGHVNPTLKLAKTLRARGHRIVYTSLPEVEDTVRAEGFDFVPVFGSIYPKGTLAELSARLPTLRGLSLLRVGREFLQRREAMFQAGLAGEYDRMLDAVRPELVLCDERVPDLPLVCHGHGVSTVRLNTTVPRHLLHTLPGTSEVARPGKPVIAVLKGLERLLSQLGLAPRFQWYHSQLASKHGCPRDAVLFPPFFLPRLPDLVLFPEAFGTPRTPEARARVHHLGPSIDLERREPAFPWERLEEGRPLVYVSLGTMAYTSRLMPRLLRVAAEAAARRPDWRFVLAVGTALEPARFEELAPNVIAVRHAPQLQLLRKAAAMVTHAGFNSVKECIYFGVPMVALPMQHDQPDVARMVVHHGLGVKGHPARLDVDGLLALLDEVVGHHPARAQALEEMKARFREAESPEANVTTVERFLGSARARVTATG